MATIKRARRQPPSFETLRDEYEGLWANCDIRQQHRNELVHTAGRIFSNRPRYDDVAKATGVPWFVVGIIHQMECGLSFDKHLHNGDSLRARTKLVPSGRPTAHNGPFTWLESAIDAMTMPGKEFHKITDWSLPRIAWVFESYNGWGYRLYRNIHSPYLWSYTTLYTSGKYIRDKIWSDTAVSKQSGAMALLKMMIEMDRSAIDIHEPVVVTWSKAVEFSPETVSPPSGILTTAATSRTAWSIIISAVSLVVSSVKDAAQVVAEIAKDAVESIPQIVSDTKENVAAFTDLAQTVGIASNVQKVALFVGLAFLLISFVRHVDLKRNFSAGEEE